MKKRFYIKIDLNCFIKKNELFLIQNERYFTLTHVHSSKKNELLIQNERYLTLKKPYIDVFGPERVKNAIHLSFCVLIQTYVYEKCVKKISYKNLKICEKN